MPIIIAIIAIAIIIYLIYLLIVYVILPIAGFLAVASCVIGVIYAFIISLISFIKSLSDNWNPYATYIDKNKHIPVGVRRSYFFGPGYHHIKIIVTGAFENQKEHIDTLSSWTKNAVKYKEWYLSMWIWIFYGVAYLCTFIMGSIWVAIFSAILFFVIFTGMSFFFIFFSLLWLTDRYVLWIESIHSRCPNDKRISIVPVFVCPNCGIEHKNLTPGPYGIFKRKCTCGKRLSTTFITGRSKLQARCPFCMVELVTSNARQFGIQLVGGVSSGKTTFLAAFLQKYIEKLGALHYLSYEVSPIDAFKELEYWYQKGLSSSTTERNANMYSIIHKIVRRLPYQLTIYDIAGEAFNEKDEVQQQQFKYCEGFIFVIDPTAKSNVANETISSFVSESKGLTGKHSTNASSIPLAVVISKSDIFKQDIGLPKIQSCIEGNESFEQARNRICKEFLESHNFGNTLNTIEAEYSNVQYFPISAMGHTPISGQSYEPWGVIEPTIWLLNRGNNKYSDKELLKRYFSWLKNPTSLIKILTKSFLYLIGIAILATIITALAYTITTLAPFVIDEAKQIYENYTLSDFEKARKMLKPINITKMEMFYIPIVGKNGLYKYTTLEGKDLTEAKYLRAYVFQEGRALVQHTDSLWGYIDTKGNSIASGYKQALSFKDSVAFVNKNGNIKVLDLNGNEIRTLPKDKDINSIWSFYEDFAIISINGSQSYIDKNYNLIGGGKYFLDGNRFQERVASVMCNNDKYAYINSNAGFITKCIFSEAKTFRNSKAIVKVDDRWGVINKQGNYIFGPYNDVEMIIPDDDMFKFKRKNGNWGWLNSNGKIAIESYYEEAMNFDDRDIAPVKQNGLWGYIDKNGKYIINRQYNVAYPFFNDRALVKINDNFVTIDRREIQDLRTESSKIDPSYWSLINTGTVGGPRIMVVEPSFKCPSSIKVEKMVCQSAKLAKLDKDMDELFKKWKNDKGVTSSQKKFLADRNRCSTMNCIESAYKNRIYKLSSRH